MHMPSHAAWHRTSVKWVVSVTPRVLPAHHQNWLWLQSSFPFPFTAILDPAGTPLPSQGGGRGGEGGDLREQGGGSGGKEVPAYPDSP